MHEELKTLVGQVQENCHISDARHAREYTLCIYLLKMREYFRWERGYGYGDPLPNAELSRWLSEREARWEQLEERPFIPLTLDQRTYDPFASDALNAALAPHGLLYSGGIGGFAKPHFFLARLEEERRVDGLRILVSGREYARDLTAPPAMAQHRTIYIRRESLRRMIWERYEEWRWHRDESAMARAVEHYPFAEDPDRALAEITAREMETVILHEQGELEAQQLLGPEWEEMLAELGRSRLEFLARAVRDHLADCLRTLPALLERNERASLHFYFANFNGIRRQIFPALADAYTGWRECAGPPPLAEPIARGREHWLRTARTLLAHYTEGDLHTLEQEPDLLEHFYLT